MLLVAELRRVATGTLGAGDRSQLEAMIERSNNTAANAVFARVGAAGVRDVAQAARMSGFELSTSDRQYRLGESRVTAEDQARFFARIDLLMPAAQRAAGMAMLAAIEPGQRWGFFDSGLPGPVYAKAGWFPERSGWTVNQAAHFTADGAARGMAVLTDENPSESYGHDTLRLLGAALADRPAQDATAEPAVGGCDVAGAAGDPAAGVQLAPGDRARLLPDGSAAAPQDAPATVKAMVAAGNRIVGKPYSQRPPHGVPYTRLLDHYDCSSSIAFILFWAGFIADPDQNWVSGDLGSVAFGDAGAGHWVTVRGNAGHVYMYVAGLRWDTHRYGAADTGSSGIGWHTAQRDDIGYTARHPTGL